MMTLGELVAATGGELRGADPAAAVAGLATLQNAGPEHVSFLANPRYRKYLKTTRAAAVILAPENADSCPVPVIIAPNPQLAYAAVAALFAPRESRPQGIHPTAWVSDTAEVATDAWIGPQAAIEDGAVIEGGVFVGPHCVIGKGAVIGAQTRLVARVTVCHGVRIGRRVVVHPGAVIGSDGFGFAKDGQRWIKIPQLGSVRIGDDVEIGANTSIDRGTLEDTVIEDGVILDNQIQVGHNVFIGAHTAAAGCVGICGSARIGRRCSLGGGAGINGHLEIVDDVHITGMSMVSNSITEPGVYSSGLSVEPNRLWNKISARLRRLDELFKRVSALEKKMPKDALD